MNEQQIFDQVATSLFNLLVSHKLSLPPLDDEGKSVNVDISFYSQLAFRVAKEYLQERELFLNPPEISSEEG